MTIQVTVTISFVSANLANGTKSQLHITYHTGNASQTCELTYHELIERDITDWKALEQFIRTHPFLKLIGHMGVQLVPLYMVNLHRLQKRYEQFINS